MELRKKILKGRFVREKVEEGGTQKVVGSPGACDLLENAHISAHGIIAYTGYNKNFEI